MNLILVATILENMCCFYWLVCKSYSKRASLEVTVVERLCILLLLSSLWWIGSADMHQDRSFPHSVPSLIPSTPPLLVCRGKGKCVFQMHKTIPFVVIAQSFRFNCILTSISTFRHLNFSSQFSIINGSIWHVRELISLLLMIHLESLVFFFAASDIETKWAGSPCSIRHSFHTRVCFQRTRAPFFYKERRFFLAIMIAGLPPVMTILKSIVSLWWVLKTLCISKFLYRWKADSSERIVHNFMGFLLLKGWWWCIVWGKEGEVLFLLQVSCLIVSDIVTSS